jgi:hypothetical protein
MAASTGDKITDVRNAARPNSARATGTRAAGGTSLACDNLAGWPTASKVHFVTYQIDSSSAVVAGTQLDCTGIVSGNTIGSFTVKDGTDVGNSVNDVVEMLPTASWGQDLADALTNQHTRTGAHTGITTDTITVTSGTTLPAGDIATADLANASVTANKLATGAVVGTALPQESTASTSYVDLTTTTDTATVTIGANGLALVAMRVDATNSVQNALCFISLDISGANTISATTNETNGVSGFYQAYGGAANGLVTPTLLMTGLTAGSTVFKLKYRVADGGGGAGTGSFAKRKITVIPL